MQHDIPPEITASGICAALGRRTIAKRIGVLPTAVSNAAVDGRFPAAWFAEIKAMCAEAQIECPHGLFRWKSAAPVETHEAQP